ncbi:hypothetical protein RB195_008615 [Necator americanus]|uniref:PSI domain-containing protein n=2 Tax=Necator americanus TaxID=51031 RepID=A0ABR1CPH6_NECAM
MLLRISVAAPTGVWLLWMPLIAVGNAQSLTDLVGLGEFTETQRKYCEFAPGEKQTCENCVAKGSECFYCGGTVERCLPYAWYFPGCELNDVKHNKCWVNISAVVAVVSVIAGILLVIFVFCFCYCCCRCHAYRRARAKKQQEKYNFQQELKRAEMQNRHSLRTKQREQELESYRIKYGLPTRMSPDGNPI